MIIYSLHSAAVCTILCRLNEDGKNLRRAPEGESRFDKDGKPETANFVKDSIIPIFSGEIFKRYCTSIREKIVQLYSD